MNTPHSIPWIGQEPLSLKAIESHIEHLASIEQQTKNYKSLLACQILDLVFRRGHLEKVHFFTDFDPFEDYRDLRFQYFFKNNHIVEDDIRLINKEFDSLLDERQLFRLNEMANSKPIFREDVYTTFAKTLLGDSCYFSWFSQCEGQFLSNDVPDDPFRIKPNGMSRSL